MQTKAPYNSDSESVEKVRIGFAALSLLFVASITTLFWILLIGLMAGWMGFAIPPAVLIIISGAIFLFTTVIVAALMMSKD